MAEESITVDAEVLSPESEPNNSNLVSITGYNLNAVVTPVKCGNCAHEFYIKPDTIEDVDWCSCCGTEFTEWDDEF